MEKEVVGFSFGKNWLDYIDGFNQEKYTEIKQSMVDLFGNLLRGKSFLDIGCGSGVFSFAAAELGAEHVLSIDVDPDSVLAANKIKKMYKKTNWNVLQGSIIDENFLKATGKFDIVYSWGVLHHTGNMWKGIDNAVTLVQEKGLLAIAIYNKTITSSFWLWFKRFYNRRHSDFTRRLMVMSIYIPRVIVRIIKMKNPWKERRGMVLYYNAVDWAGGLPYEYASFEEVSAYLQKKGFKLIKYKRTKMNGCNEFLFLKQ